MPTTPSRLRDAYGRQPDVAWSAPGRANLIGEHTDYNDGFVLPFAITERTAVAAARRDDGTITVALHLRAEDRHRPGRRTSRPGAVDGWAGYPLGVAWALARVRDRAGRRGRRPVHPLGRAGRRGAVVLGGAGDGGGRRARRPVGARR